MTSDVWSLTGSHYFEGSPHVAFFVCSLSYVDLPIKTKEWPECADRYLFAVRFGNRHDEALNARPIWEP